MNSATFAQKKWKTCQCATWDENRLIERAEKVAARQEPAPNQQAVHQVAEAMRPGQACKHPERWPRIEGEYDCEICNTTMEDYILECPERRLRACMRCRRNRL